MLVDDTLREGLQSPGMSFKIEEKLKLAELISKTGIKTAIVSYPSAHSSEIIVTKEILKRKYFSEVFALGRTIIEDIDIIYDSGANISLHLPFEIKNSEKIFEAIKYASKKGKLLEVGLVNITEYNETDLIKLAKKIEENGADRIQIADTLGSATPKFIYKIIKGLKEQVSIPINVHCHNDVGLAVTNAISAIDAGANFVDTTIFGIGERNGIVDTITLSTLLMKEGYSIRIDTDALLKAYEYLESLIYEKIGNISFLNNFPIYGKNTRISTAGTHAAFEKVFKKNEYSINVYTGRNMIKNILQNNNIKIDEQKLATLVKKIKDVVVETGKALNENDIINMVRD
ncbi:MAG: hypothetical protein QXT18_02485 [Thermoplasmata archaeon]